MMDVLLFSFLIIFFKQKTAYEMRISDWSSDVCSSDLLNYRRFLTSELNADTQGFLPPTRGEIDGPTAAQPTVSFGKQRYNTESFAPFASIQYDITDALHFNLSGRYDIEKRSVAEIAHDATNPVTGANYNLCIPLPGRPSEHWKSTR